jgi:hypothetical protein
VFGTDKGSVIDHTLATAFGLGHTIFSKWLKIVARKGRAYSDLMPVIPAIDAGLVCASTATKPLEATRR